MTGKDAAQDKARKLARSFSRGIKKLKTREEWHAFYEVAVAELRCEFLGIGSEHPKQFRRLKMLANSFETLSMSVQRASQIESSG